MGPAGHSEGGTRVPVGLVYSVEGEAPVSSCTRASAS
jgi:hypothetical protein